VAELVPFEFHQPGTRASDGERQAIVAVLQRHYAEGRLDLTEFEARSEAALACRTQGELVPLISDLPAIVTSPERRSGPPVRPRSGGGAMVFNAYLRLWIVLAVMFNVIWLLTTPGDYYWPIWPMFGTSIPLLFLFAFRGDKPDA
jgi:Domain of unknown function (DUF1707)